MRSLLFILLKNKARDQVFVNAPLQARRRICCTVKAIIEERRRDASGKSSERSDFLEILLRVDSLSQDEKVSFVLDSLLGGYETTSVLMAMVVHFLAQSPTALAHLKVIFFFFTFSTV